MAVWEEMSVVNKYLNVHLLLLNPLVGVFLNMLDSVVRRLTRESGTCVWARHSSGR